MELLEKLADKLVAAGPWGMLAAVLIAVLVAMAWTVRRLYLDGQCAQQASINDAKEYARGLAAGIATLDAIRELSKEMFAVIAATRNKGR